MPSRIVREGILTSLAVDKLSCGGEVFYRRLLNVVDDFGRYHGTPALLRAAAFPLKIDGISDDNIRQWVAECVKTGLVTHYTVDNLPYIQVEKFGTPRAKESKFPSPNGENTNVSKCKQMQTDANIRTVVVNVNESVNEYTSTKPRKSTKVDAYSEAFEQFWKTYPNAPSKGGKRAAFKAYSKLKDSERGQAIEAAEVFAEAWERATKGKEYVPNASTWLNEGRWDDDLQSLANRWADKYGVYE